MSISPDRTDYAHPRGNCAIVIAIRTAASTLSVTIFHSGYTKCLIQIETLSPVRRHTTAEPQPSLVLPFTFHQKNNTEPFRNAQ